MLKIQVLGKGLIPRGLGLAPRTEPFPADMTLIHTILCTNGLTVRYIHPETGQPRDLDNKNLKKVYERWGSTEYKKVPVAQPQQNPAPAAPVQQPSINQPVMEENPEPPKPQIPVAEPQEYHTKVSEETVDKKEDESENADNGSADADVFKPVGQPENNQQHTNGYNNQQNNKNKSGKNHR